MADMCEEFVFAVAAVGLACVALAHKKGGKEKKSRRWWTRPWLERRDEGQGRGVLSMLQHELILDSENYFSFLRMNEELFMHLLSLVENKITRKDTNMRQSIPAMKRLAVTLRFLATGETFKSLSFATRIAHNTLSKIIPEVLRALIESLQAEFLKVPKTEDDWLQVSRDYEQKWNFPHCIGSMDGKHITFRPPRTSGSFYRNYKGTNSIVLLALVDADYKFLYIDVGRNGRVSDGGVFKRSNLCRALQTGRLNIPQPKPLPGRVTPIPYVVVADDAFPLSPNIMKPYRYRGLNHEQTIFNYRLSRARRVVENVFGQMCNKFRVLLNPINLSVEKVELITISCCILHNFIRINQRGNQIQSLEEDLECPLTEIVAQAGNRTSQEALEVRREFQEYFNTGGAVPWQEHRVETRNF